MHYMAFMKIMDGASKRVSRAISLAGTRQKKVEVTAVKKNRIYYRKPRSEMGVTCSGRTEAARKINSGLLRLR